MHPIWFLQDPDLTQDNMDPAVFRLKGWVAGDEPVKDVTALDQDSGNRPVMDLALREKPYIGEALKLGRLRVTGFEGSCPFKDVEARKFVTVQFAYAGRVHEIIAPVYSGKGFSMEDKPLKLARLEPFLICPNCRDGGLKRSRALLKCSGCKSEFAFTNSHIDFLSEESRAALGAESAEDASENEYDGIAVNFINRFKDGLILDCGAGRRSKYYGNVVNYEIVPYPSTDVLGVAESLPFRDNTFDAVFSFAVLEHVSEPFKCAAEMARVLKPGGFLYCHVPFLQPFHAYPHHYYNMTQSGLWNLFSPYMDIHKLDVLNFGHPFFALARFLALYVDGLPLRTREQFMKMTVEELLKQPANSFLGDPLVSQLSAKAEKDLSFCNYLIASKKH